MNAPTLRAAVSRYLTAAARLEWAGFYAGALAARRIANGYKLRLRAMHATRERMGRV